jgi:hypothetical protein
MKLRSFPRGRGSVPIVPAVPGLPSCSGLASGQFAAVFVGVGVVLNRITGALPGEFSSRDIQTPEIATFSPALRRDRG